jgi:tRNA threonylcarbamoyladenosine biosynthesis protein TsaE
MKKITLKSVTATQKLGAKIADVCSSGIVIYLQGDLGCGKTTLVRGFLRAFGYSGFVKSPTFTLLEPFNLQGRNIYHFDLYRLRNPEELEHIGIRDYFSANSICLIEWPEKGFGHLAPADLICEFSFSPNPKWREVTIIAESDVGQKILNNL